MKINYSKIREIARGKFPIQICTHVSAHGFSDYEEYTSHDALTHKHSPEIL